jgi:dihydrolipoamide dehydrogenase
MNVYDVIVIGGGPGGYLAAERLAAEKRSVLLLEKEHLGGTCLNVGCIPTKTLLACAKTYLHTKEAERFGVFAESVRFDFGAMQAWKAEVVARLRQGIAAKQRKLGVDVLAAEGRLLGAGRVEAAGEVREAKAIIIATGSSPVLPPIPGAQGNPHVVDSTGLLASSAVPERLAVIGGGVIGVEFACLFSALGSKVEVIEMLDEIVPFMDREQASAYRRAMGDVAFRLSSRVERLEGGTVVFRGKDGNEQRLEAELVLMAVGRKPNVSGWGATEAGLDAGPKGVVVDERMRTNLPGVWAIGDVTGKSLLAHSAYRMAEVAVSDILLGGAATKSADIMRYQAVPWVVYGLPEAAGVGLSEQAALAAGIKVKKASLPLRVSGRFCAENGFSAPGAVKVIADAGDDRILGVHVVGAYASEMIWGAAALIEQELRVRDVKQIVFPHPTVCESIREAVWEID